MRKQLTLLAIAICAAVLAAVIVSCSKSPAPPTNGPTRLTSTANPASVPQWLFGPQVGPTTKITADNLTNAQPAIPSDLYRPASDAADPNFHGQAAIYAWLEFIALTSPNGASPVRGVPGNSFGSVKGGTNSTYPLVFETYQHRSEVFPFNAAASPNASPAPGVTKPQPWDSSPNYVYSPQPTYPQNVLDKCFKAGDYSNTCFNNLDEGSQIFQNHLFFPNASDPANPYQVMFEAKVNQMEWQYVTNNCQTDATNNCNLTLSQNLLLPDGTIEVKVAWRPIASIDPSQLYRYHIANVITYTGDANTNPTAQVGQYAMIGLHIIHKTTNYPSFTFATFEQVDQFKNQAVKPATPTNVSFMTLYPTPDPNASPTPLPTPSAYQPGSYYFYVVPNGYSAAPTPSPGTFVAATNPNRVFDPNNPSAWPNGIQTSFTPAPNVSTQAAPSGTPELIKVVLPPTGTTDVDKVNNEVRALISQLIGSGGLPTDFVWQYYQLTGVQTIPSSDETTKDYYLANIVIESSQAGIQLFRGGLSPNPSFEPVPNQRNKFNVNDILSTGTTQYSMGGCMGCHGAAQGEGGDFSFLVSTGQGGFNVDTLVGTNLEQAKKNATARRALISRSTKY